MSALEAQALPDAERVIVTLLRAQPELADLDDRIYTVYPAQAGAEALIVVRRFGGAPIVGRPLVLDEALLQVEIYAQRKEESARLGSLVRALLAERAPMVALGAYRYVPDETFNPPRPRQLADITLYLRPDAPGAAARRRPDAPVDDPRPTPERG